MCFVSRSCSVTSPPRVVDVGDYVSMVSVGHRVSRTAFPCLSCEQCLAGRHNLCPRMRFLATWPIDGTASTSPSMRSRTRCRIR